MTTNDLISDDQLENYLDDLLDDFSDHNHATTKPAQEPKSVLPSIPQDLDQLDDAFIRQLAENMEALLKSSTDDSKVGTQKSYSSSKENLSGTPGFQKTVLETMEKLRESSSKVEAQVAQDVQHASLTGGLDDGDMEGMMKELEALMDSGEFDEMFTGVFDQLMTKDVLHEPLKELAKQYPEWLEKNKATLSKEDAERYQNQLMVVQKIVGLFESHADTQDSALILQYMSEMQSYGNPPESLLKSIAPEMEFGDDGLPNLPKDLKDDCKMM